MQENEQRLEMEYLALVMEKIEQEIGRCEHLRELSRQTEGSLSKEMWDEMPRLVRSFDDLVQLNSRNQEILTEARLIARITGELKDLASMQDSPYFGRIDFTDAGDGEELRIYIGKRAFADSQELDFYVYDWRSPAASMFYDYDTGPSSYQSPAGLRSGEMTLKRQYRIRRGQMEAMFDANAMVREDEILNSILMESSGRQLRVIAASIQKEQNQAIRFIEPRNVLITGPAGSGKTSVGLHRLAYMLYHNRGRLRSQEILVVSANQAFNAYIANILPDLYEEDVKRTVFDTLIQSYLPSDYAIGTRAAQTEYLLHAPKGDNRAQWLSMLYSQDFVRFLRQYANQLPIAYRDVRLGKHTILTMRQIEEHVNKVEGEQSFTDRLLRAQRYIEQECEEFFLRNDDTLRNEALDSGRDLYTEQEMLDYLLALKERCISRHQQALRDGAQLSALAQLPHAVYAYLKREDLPPALGDALKRRLQGKRLLYEDTLVLLLLKSSMGELSPAEGIRHVLIDEAQDYGAPQHALLQALFPTAVFTLLADFRQAAFAPVSLLSEEELDSLYRIPPRKFYLDRSYRSTGPINALAARVLGEDHGILYYDRPGPEPEILHTDDLAEDVLNCLARWENEAPEQAATTAILTPSTAKAKALHQELSRQGLAVSLANSAEDLPNGIVLMSMALSKGLEFDRVIIAGCDFPDNGAIQRRNALYLLCTRALHRLCVLMDGPPDTLIQSS